MRQRHGVKNSVGCVFNTLTPLLCSPDAATIKKRKLAGSARHHVTENTNFFEPRI